MLMICPIMPRLEQNDPVLVLEHWLSGCIFLGGNC